MLSLFYIAVSLFSLRSPDDRMANECKVIIRRLKKWLLLEIGPQYDACGPHDGRSVKIEPIVTLQGAQKISIVTFISNFRLTDPRLE